MRSNSEDLERRLKEAFTKPDSLFGAGFIDADALAKRRVDVTNPRKRLAQGAGAIATGLASLAAIAVVTTSVLSPPGPLFTLADGGPGMGAAESGVAESSDLRTAPYIDYRYIPGDTLSRESGRGEVFQLQLSGTPETVLHEVGSVFDIAGEVEETDYFDSRYPTYVIGSQSRSGGASVTITWLGTGPWMYFNPVSYPESDCHNSGEGGVSDGNTDRPLFECSSPTPTGPIPAVAEAQARAAEIFSQTGLPVSANQVRVIYADEWGISLSASLNVAGEDTAIEWSVGFGPDGIITYATGHSLAVESRGTFDTISAHDAVLRIQQGVWSGSPGHEFYKNIPPFAQSQAADDSDIPMGNEPAKSSDSPPNEIHPKLPLSDSEVLNDTNEVVEPLPVDGVLPSAEVEIVESVVTKASPALLLVYDANGGAWLVPGFVMIHDQGTWISTIRLAEGIIQMPDPG